MHIRTALVALAVVVTVWTGPATAAPITWTLTSSACTGVGVTDGNTRTCSGTDGNPATADPSVTASAWSNTQGTTNVGIQNALLQTFSGGLGVRNRDAYSASYDMDVNETGSPEHAVDNNQRYDSVLFGFSQGVSLTGINIGWVGADSDITVMAYAGSGVPSLAGASYGGLLGSSWTLVGHYMNVGTGWHTVNLGAVAARYWLVGAYNPLVNGASSLLAGNDAVKLFQLRADTGGFDVNAPEPASMGLFGLGLLGVARRIRRGRRA